MSLEDIPESNGNEESYVQTIRNKCGDGCEGSHWRTIGVEPLKDLTVGALVRQAATQYADREAIVSVHQVRRLTFQQVHQQCEELAAGFLSIGLRPGDHVAILGPNSIEWYLSILSAKKAGMVVVNLNPLMEVPELQYCLNKSDATAIIIDEKFNQINYTSRVATMLGPQFSTHPSGQPIPKNSYPQLPKLKFVIVFSEKTYSGMYRWRDVMRSSTKNSLKDLHQIEINTDCRKPCNIQFTSGTTGNPKGALLTHRNIVNNSYFTGKRLTLGQMHHRILLQVPLFHTFGTVIGILNSLHYGATLVLPSPKFSPTRSLQAIVQEKCTFIFGTPTMYIDMLSTYDQIVGPEKLTTLECAFTSGAICTPELFRRLKQTFHLKYIFSGYGMTECSPIVFSSQVTDTEFQVTSTIGYVLEHAEVKVVDECGNIVPFGEEGEVLFKGYMVMKGYYNDPEVTANAIASGWMKSGDKFVLLEDGYGKVVGRLKDTIIRGGENIEPSEIENVLATHPYISAVQVYGVSDDRLGEVVAASIITQPDINMSEEEIRRFCKGKFSEYKIPKHIEFVRDYPKTATAKVQKYKLRENMERKLKKQCDSKTLKVIEE